MADSGTIIVRDQRDGALFTPDYRNTTEVTFAMTESRLKMLRQLNVQASILVAVGPASLGTALGIVLDAFLLGEPKPAMLPAIGIIIGILVAIGIGSLVWFGATARRAKLEAPDCSRRDKLGLWPWFKQLVLGPSSARSGHWSP